MQRPGFLDFKDFRYLKLAGALMAIALLIYWATKPAGGATYGGTWFGYVLGITAALIVLVLAWYGIRKRRPPIAPERRREDRRRVLYADSAANSRRNRPVRRRKRAKDSWRHGTSLQGWLSVHVYLGLALLVIATLHTGVRFDWNVHTLAYVLMLLVVGSGAYGSYAYLRYPRLITENLGDDTAAALLAKIAELDALASQRTVGLPDEVKALVAQARQDDLIGGNLFRQIANARGRSAAEGAVQRIQELGKELVSGDEPRRLRDLYSVLLQKQNLLARARNDIRFNARMKFWLYLHVPLTLGLMAALAAHVMAILIYW